LFLARHGFHHQGYGLRLGPLMEKHPDRGELIRSWIRWNPSRLEPPVNIDPNLYRP